MMMLLCACPGVLTEAPSGSPVRRQNELCRRQHASVYDAVDEPDYAPVPRSSAR